MILSDWVSILPPIVALVVLYLDKKISKSSGPLKVADRFPSITKEGKIVPAKWDVRQGRIKRLRTFLLWTMAVVGILVVILRKLGW